MGGGVSMGLQGEGRAWCGDDGGDPPPSLSLLININGEGGVRER
jgi:hypothetical protein